LQFFGVHTSNQAATLNHKSLKRFNMFPDRHLGLAGPEPLPHPDDILIDFRTGEVTFKGPRTREQKAAQEEMIALKEGLEADAKILEELVQKLPNNRRLAKALGEPLRGC
jgi:hypothetical protein